MKVMARKLIGTRITTPQGVGGKVDDLFFDVRTGDVTHLSVALTGWYRGNIVLVPLDSCCVQYTGNRLVFQQLSLEDMRNAPLLDEESAQNAMITDLLVLYEDTASCWTLSGQIGMTHSRSESIEAKTGQPALWGTRDLAKAPVLMDHGKKLGRVADLVVDTDTWHVTHLNVWQGHWYWPTEMRVPAAALYEVEKNDGSATVLLHSPLTN